MGKEERPLPSGPAPTRAGPDSAFRSILFDGAEPREDLDGSGEPAYFPDLNLDQIIDSITAGREEYALKPIFYQRPRDLDTVYFRHEVLRDLERAPVTVLLNTFATRMRQMREHLAQAKKLHHHHQQQSWFLNAVEIYCDAVDGLSQGLRRTEVGSRGLLGFRDYLTSYVEGARFTTLASDTKHLKQRLSAVSYLLHIKGNRVRVRKFDSEADFSAEVATTFARFKQRAVKDYRVTFSDWPEMNPVESTILDLVARLFGDVFSELDGYFARHQPYLDQLIENFDREVQFYLAYLEYITRFKSVGLQFCYPEMSRTSKEIFAKETFDLALAATLVPEGSPVVGNDFELVGEERIFVVSGPNQGGKTTFARTFGQLHHLASLGYPVPGTSARLFLFDRLFTHFEREEDPADLSGKLEDDLMRLRRMLSEATADSLVIMNEIFTSTTLNDARFLGEKVIERIVQLDLLCVYVTFVEELASLSGSIVSMVSTIVPERPEQRTFKVVRRPPDGLAYAIAIAEQHGLTYDRLKQRMAR
ncbi:MAG: DNA mismatch repair protein MutS [Candidatus Dormiibacterota bacterium]